MILAWTAVLMAAQPAQRPPTVGDTVWVSTRVPLGARQILRAQTWDLGEIGQVLGPPDVAYEGDSAIVRYPVTFWYPGVHAIAVPGPIVVNPEGRSDTLDARPLSIEVATVLPPSVPRDSLVPRDQADLLVQTERSPLPVVLLWLMVALVAGGITWLRRSRRHRPEAVPAAPPPETDVGPVLVQWGRAGETRAAAEGWSQLIHARLAAGPGDDKGLAIATALDELGFQPGALPARVDDLLTQAAAWVKDRTPRG